MSVRIDGPFDPFIPKDAGRVREPKRMESFRTLGSTEPQRLLYSRVRGASDQSIPSGLLTTVLWNGTPEINVGGMFDTATNDRFTIPSTGRVTGLWMCHAGVLWEANATGRRDIFIVQNTGGSGTSRGSSKLSGQSATEEVSQDATAYILDPQFADFFTVIVFQNSGVALNIRRAIEPSIFELAQLW